MHIVMLSSEYKPRIRGGIGTHVVHLSESLVKENIKVSVVNWNAPWEPEQPRLQIINGIQVFRLPCQYNLIEAWGKRALANLYYLAGVMDIAQRTSIDVLHAHDVSVGLAALLAKDILKIPLITTVHLQIPYNKNQPNPEMYVKIKTDLIEASDAVIAVSNSVKNEMLKHKPQANIITIYNGIHITETESPKKHASKNILFVGRLVYDKGLDILIKSLSILKDRFRFKLTVVGEGAAMNDFRNLAVDLDMGREFVDFIGYVDPDRVFHYYQQSDIVVIPSVHEAFGFVALEAMAQERPVIASRVGGLQELIQHGENGLLVNPNDEADLARAITTLLEDSDFAVKLAAAAKKRSRDFTWKKIADQTIALYRTVSREASGHFATNITTRNSLEDN